MIPVFKAPFVVVWEITDSCNLCCLHCRASCDGIRRVTRNKEVERFVLDYVARNHVFVVNISGGEPLVHPELVELVRDLSDSGVHVGVSTNGLLWRRLGERLVAAGLKYVQISLDGPPEVHNRIRGNRHAFDGAVAALRSARAQGIQVQMNTVLSRLVAPHLEWVYNFAQQLDVKLHVRRLIPIGSATINATILPSPEEHMALLRKLVALRERGLVEMDIEDPLAALVTPIGLRPNVGCGAGSSQIAITMDGDILPCVFFRHCVGNVLVDGLDSIWTSDSVLRSIRQRESPGCHACGLAASCGGCRACARTPYDDDPLCPAIPAG